VAAAVRVDRDPRPGLAGPVLAAVQEPAFHADARVPLGDEDVDFHRPRQVGVVPPPAPLVLFVAPPLVAPPPPAANVLARPPPWRRARVARHLVRGRPLVLGVPRVADPRPPRVRPVRRPGPRVRHGLRLWRLRAGARLVPGRPPPPARAGQGQRHERHDWPRRRAQEPQARRARVPERPVRRGLDEVRHWGAEEPRADDD